MLELSKADARAMLDSYDKDKKFEIPSWFQPEHLRFLFPIDQRPSTVDSYVSTPSSPEEAVRTSVRREEDEARRKAMHELVTRWERAARTTARDLVDHLYRGARFKSPQIADEKLDFSDPSFSSLMGVFQSLIPDAPSTERVTPLTSASPYSNINSLVPVKSVGGYSVTETVGPLAMLARLCRTKSPAIIWVKEKVRMSHGKRTVRIRKREGTIVLFDRHTNVVFVPAGRAADRWEFIRGALIALIQVPSS